MLRLTFLTNAGSRPQIVFGLYGEAFEPEAGRIYSSGSLRALPEFGHRLRFYLYTASRGKTSDIHKRPSYPQFPQKKKNQKENYYYCYY